VSSTTTKVIAGCSVGCLLVVAAAAMVGWLGYRWAKDAVATVENAAATQHELTETFGRVDEFVPSLDPGVPADRLEVFLSVREALSEPRRELIEAVDLVAPPGDGSQAPGGLRMAAAGARLAPRTLALTNARNQTLLDAGMGLGEYTWIYWLSYHAWLGHPVGESQLHEVMAARAAAGESMQLQFSGNLEPESIRWRLRLDLVSMLENLVTALEGDPQRRQWRLEVTTVLAETEADPEKLPWGDGVPDPVAQTLEPYREGLEATYSQATNVFELLDLD
jgi:hypothetical protein